MIQTAVTSSNLKRVGWENENLYVEFHHGGVYAYHAVPFQVYNDLVGSPSVGKFFSSLIKNAYTWTASDISVFGTVSA